MLVAPLMIEILLMESGCFTDILTVNNYYMSKISPALVRFLQISYDRLAK